MGNKLYNTKFVTLLSLDVTHPFEIAGSLGTCFEQCGHSLGN